MDIYEKITASIIEAIERGAADPKGWRMPWHRKGADSRLPYNAVSGRAYQGCNVFALWCAQQARGYAAPAWATLKQWNGVDARVRKGEKATSVILFRRVERKEKGAEEVADEKGKRSFLLAREFWVFNAAQVDGYEHKEPVRTPDLTAAHGAADAIIASSGATIRHGGTEAYYQPGGDYIAMPDRWRFLDSETSTATESYYATHLHELCHWTGHKARLGRDGIIGPRNLEIYAFEELVAELGSAFACARLGISNDPRPDHAHYVAAWVKRLRDDRKAIVSAASKAQAACGYLMDRLPAPAAEPAPDQEPAAMAA